MDQYNIVGCSVSWFWQEMLSWFFGINNVMQYALQLALQAAAQELTQTFNVGQTFEPIQDVVVSYRVTSMAWTANSNVVVGFNSTLAVIEHTTAGPVNVLYEAQWEDAGQITPSLWNLTATSPYNNSGTDVLFDLMNGVQLSSTLVNGMLWAMYTQSAKYQTENTTLLDAFLNVSIGYSCPYLTVPYNDGVQLGVDTGDAYVTCRQNMTGSPALVLNFTFSELEANATMYYKGNGNQGGLVLHVFAIDANNFKPVLYWPQIPMPQQFLNSLLVSAAQAMVPGVNIALQTYPWMLPATAVPLVAYPILTIRHQGGCCGNNHGYIELDSYCTCQPGPQGWMRCQHCPTSSSSSATVDAAITSTPAAEESSQTSSQTPAEKTDSGNASNDANAAGTTASAADANGANVIVDASYHSSHYSAEGETGAYDGVDSMYLPAPVVFAYIYGGPNCTIDTVGSQVNMYKLLPTHGLCSSLQDNGNTDSFFYSYDSSNGTLKLHCDENCTDFSCLIVLADHFAANQSNTCYNENGVSVLFAPDATWCDQRLAYNATTAANMTILIQANQTWPDPSFWMSATNVGLGDGECLPGVGGMYFESWMNRSDYDALSVWMNCEYANCSGCSGDELYSIPRGYASGEGVAWWYRLGTEVTACPQPPPTHSLSPLPKFFIGLGVVTAVILLTMVACHCGSALRWFRCCLCCKCCLKQRGGKRAPLRPSALAINDGSGAETASQVAKPVSDFEKQHDFYGFRWVLPCSAVLFVAAGGALFAQEWFMAFPFNMDQSDERSGAYLMNSLLNVTQVEPLLTEWRNVGTGCGVVGVAVAFMFLLLDFACWKRTRGILALVGFVINIALIFLVLLALPILVNLSSLVHHDFQPGTVVADNSYFSNALQSLAQMTWISFLLGRVSMLFMLLYGAVASSLFFGYASAYVFAAWDSKHTTVRLGRCWTAIGVMQALQPVACILPAVLLGQTFGATIWWMLAWIATWIWPVAGHAVLRVGASPHTRKRLGGAIAICAFMFAADSALTLFLIKQQDPLLNLIECALLWLACVLICYPTGWYSAVVDQMLQTREDNMELHKSMLSYDSIDSAFAAKHAANTDLQEPPPSANAPFRDKLRYYAGRFKEKATFRNVFLFLGTACLGVDVLVLQLSDLIKYSPVDEITSILQDIFPGNLVWPANCTIFTPALEMYRDFSWASFGLMTVLFILCVIMCCCVIFNVGQLLSKLIAIAAGAVVVTAIIILITPSYLDATNLSTLCPFCAPKFNSAVHTIASSFIGVFCAALLALNVVIALIAVPPSTIRALTAVKLGQDHRKDALFTWSDFSLSIVVASTPLALMLPAAVCIQIFNSDTIIMLVWTLLAAPPLVYILMRQVSYRFRRRLSPGTWSVVVALTWSIAYISCLLGLVVFIVIQQGYTALFLQYTVYSASFWLEVFAEVMLSNVILTDIIYLQLQ
eukprot:TRINITY_DN5733_c0_g1_i1.p1 TRINITY_DN5733_c0_g1~~TRINITY_DN5733_c0_g1_i1.p1  ORF type:complete len:1644 (-),score=331.87 TRINITY_DN5733_c0_g1_i1:843-5183(-)